MRMKNLKEFVIDNGDLYHQDSGGVLTGALTLTEAKEVMSSS